MPAKVHISFDGKAPKIRKGKRVAVRCPIRYAPIERVVGFDQLGKATCKACCNRLPRFLPS